MTSVVTRFSEAISSIRFFAICSSLAIAIPHSASAQLVGSLEVTLLPPAVNKAGAQWQVNGGNLANSGATIANLSVGQHTVNFSAVSGYATPPSQNVMITANTTNFITVTYTPIIPPTVTIGNLKSGMKVSNVLFQIDGTATGTDLSGVYYQFNGGRWTLAEPGNTWSNWSAPGLIYLSGTNVFSVYATDTSGDLSVTDTVSFIFVPSAIVAVNTNGFGTIKPDLDGDLLALGTNYSMTAKAGKGFAFVKWTGSITTNTPKLSFTMARGDEFTANFKDVTRPVVIILSPAKNHVVTNAAPIATGRATDNVGVTAIQYSVNGGAWMPASFPDGTNWTTTNLAPFVVAGANTISVFALDGAENASLTNTVSFKYAVPESADWAPDFLNGFTGSFARGSFEVDATNPETFAFDGSTFSELSPAPGATNFSDYGFGTYSYDKTFTNMAQLTYAFTNPPGASNGMGPFTMVFTNKNVGYFTNAMLEQSIGFAFNVATNLVPSTLAGKTITATDDNTDNPIGAITTIKLSKTGNSLTQTTGTNTSSGTYTFTRRSPACGVLAFDFTSGIEEFNKVYTETFFTNATAGRYVTVTFDNLGIPSIDVGGFVVK